MSLRIDQRAGELNKLFALGYLIFLSISLCHAQATYPWTILIPENDTRAQDEIEFDDFDSNALVRNINNSETAFHNRMIWERVPIKNLLHTPTDFCELRFDAVHQLILTADEKSILKEYVKRGGFILLVEDTYPYAEEEFWKVKNWPVIDFFTKELTKPDFSVIKINDSHPIFHQLYETKTAEFVQHELRDNPYTPNRTLLSYKGHPCAFVFGSYGYLENGRWAPTPKPYPRVFSLNSRSYRLTVNIYVYSMSN